MTFYTKSILSLILLGSTLIAFFTMFELMGRKEKRFNPKLLRTVHRINGYCFLILFIILSYYCLKIMRAAGVEPSPRVALHGLLALATMASSAGYYFTMRGGPLLLFPIRPG